MSRTALVGTFAFVVAGLTGCTSPARVVQLDKASVLVAIPDNTNTWPFYHQDAARAEAAKAIPNPQLVTATRVKVGESMTNRQDMTRRDLTGPDQDPQRFGEVTSATNTTTVSDQYEYHLEFRSTAPMPGTHPNYQGGAGGTGITPAGGLPPRGADAGRPAPISVNPPPAGDPTSLPSTPIGGAGGRP